MDYNIQHSHVHYVQLVPDHIAGGHEILCVSPLDALVNSPPRCSCQVCYKSCGLQLKDRWLWISIKKNTYHPCRLAHWTNLHNSANTPDQSRNQHEDAQEKLYKFKSEASNSAQEAIRWQSHQKHVKRNMLQSIPVAAVSSCTRALKMEKHMAAHQEWKVNDMEKVNTWIRWKRDEKKHAGAMKVCDVVQLGKTYGRASYT